MKKMIGIIGAGISGLLACKHAMEKGFNPMVFEAKSGIGGIWSQTIESTRLQSPKNLYQFADFAWPSSVKEIFPDHNKVMEYLQAYAIHFNILSRIKFNSRVTCIDYAIPSDEEDLNSWDLWGGTGNAISPTGKWVVSVQDAKDSSALVEEYQLDFVILCIGRFSDLPYIPVFPVNKGPEVFGGQVLHSMDFAAMDDDRAAEFIKNKRVTVIGSQKSATDLAAQIAERNGAQHPCTMLFRNAYWIFPEYLVWFTFKGLNRISAFMVHKPDEGLFSWILAILLSPLLWIFSKSVECYLKWTQPLKKYNMVPSHSLIKQISSCSLTSLPANFYAKVKEGSLILKKSQSFSFCKNGLFIEGEESPIETEIVIFATGYKSEEKLKNIFKSNYFQKCIIESSAPLYRDCIHPRIPQLAILGYAYSHSDLYTTEMRSTWVAHFLARKFKLPTISEMEAQLKKWEECMRYYTNERYRSACLNALHQIYCNDQLCKDMGYNPRRRTWFLAELFAPYCPDDYKYLCYQ